MKKVLGLFKRIKLSTLIWLILLLSFSSYSWMIYVSKVSTGISAHVTSWDVNFKVGQDSVTTEIIFDVEQIYPGMDDFTQQVIVNNNGELDGVLSYEIRKIEILGTTYEVSDSVTSDDLLAMMQSDFPFKLNVEVEGDATNVIPVNGTRNVNISLVWPLDSGNDELDTEWGQNAYQFYKDNDGEETCIHIEMLLRVTQQG